MKEIFDWMRGAILDKAFEGYNGQTLVDIHDVGDLINEAEAKWESEREGIKLEDFLVICKSRYIRAYEGRNGKLVFDTRRNKKEYVKRFKECEVLDIWTEVHTDAMIGFTQFVGQYICVYLHSGDVDKVLSNKVVE